MNELNRLEYLSLASLSSLVREKGCSLPKWSTMLPSWEGYWPIETLKESQGKIDFAIYWVY
jgi:hypothetical protein